ncbi:helix-turn-helix domain-containing protein, partial [Dactylosporangium salmoneum]|uniref:helix-turn-helix domain-containing protein n=1 Tax=Dactylosporangium salmoneum TaxID=53361 RepID=UPI0031D516B2
MSIGGARRPRRRHAHNGFCEVPYTPDVIDRHPPATRVRWRGDLSVAQIAQLAGVSQPTVSKVLNGRAGVSDST